MLDGLPQFFKFTVDLVMADRGRGPLAVLTHYLLGDVVNAAEYALTHYFPLSLSEPCLQNSSIGTPYQKWAKFTAEDFENLDRSLRRVMPIIWKLYYETRDQDPGRFARQFEGSEPDHVKGAWHWFYQVNLGYACCIVNCDQSILSVTSVNITDWLNTTSGRFMRFANRPPMLPPAPRPEPPAIFTTFVRDISDRTVIAELHQVGLARIRELCAATSRLAEWIRENYTIDDATAPPEGTLSDCDFDF